VIATFFLVACMERRAAHEAQRRAGRLNRGQAQCAHAARRVDRQANVARSASRRIEKIEQVVQHRSRVY
jgi:hypothetical protein